MTEPPAVRQGYPALEMASSDAPQRTVLAPPPEFGIDWRRVGTMLAAALNYSANSDTRSVVATDREGHTVYARSRILESAEVGTDRPPTDRSSRPIVVVEGVIFAGPASDDPDRVLQAARSQFARVIQDYWNDSAGFGTPRYSAPLGDPVPLDDSPVEQPAPKPATPGRTTEGPGPDLPPPPPPPGRPVVVGQVSALQHRRQTRLPRMLILVLVLVLVLIAAVVALVVVVS